MPYLHKKQMEPIAFSFAPCFLQSVVCAEDCCKSGLSSVSEVLERALSPHSLLHQTQAAQRGTLIYFMEYYFLCVTMAAAIKRSPSHRYYLILHIHTHADSHTHTQTHTQAKEESLLIFISHMFSSQREKLTYREVITVTQRGGGGASSQCICSTEECCRSCPFLCHIQFYTIFLDNTLRIMTL